MPLDRRPCCLVNPRAHEQRHIMSHQFTAPCQGMPAMCRKNACIPQIRLVVEHSQLNTRKTGRHTSVTCRQSHFHRLWVSHSLCQSRMEMHNQLEGKRIRNGRDIQPQNQGMSICKIHPRRYGMLRVGHFQAGVASRRGPLGVFLFVGPTGVGKTELARTLGEDLFGSDGSAIRLGIHRSPPPLPSLRHDPAPFV